MATNVVGNTSITMELDDSQLLADMPEAERIISEFTRRMTIAARVRVHREVNEFNKEVLRINVDPRTTEAGMEVIRKIVAEYTSRIERDANVTVGVRTTPIRTAMSRLRDFMAREGQSISDGIHFWMSRGLLKAARDLIKLPAEMIKESFGKFLTAEAATTKLGKALAATGEASGKSKQELIDYAKQLEKTTLIADQVTMGVQGILLASEGLTGINFDRATRGALDLSTALGGDAATHAARLGKSLQDPVRGMEMLRDAGIAFSQEQQDTIKFLAETNNLVAAQGILLDELESRFGGAAENTGSLNEKLKEQSLNYENLQEKIGEVAAESVDSFIPAMEAGILTLQEFAPPVLAAATVMAELATELAYSVLGIDQQKKGVAALVEETDKWIASMKSAITMTKVLAKELTDFGPMSGKEKLDWIADGQPDLMERVMSKMDRLTERELKKRQHQREQRKKQAEEDAKQAKEDWKKEQDAKGIGQGKLSDAAKAAVQQAKDAKDAIKRNKDEQEQKRKEEAEFARQDAEAIRDHAKKVRDAQKAAREQEAKDKKKAKAEEKMLADEWSHEKKKMMAKEKEEAAEKAALARANGRESLIGMHDRIQDARFLNRPNTGSQMTTKQHAMSNGIKLTVEQEKVVDAVKAQTKAVVEAISKPFSALIGK